MSNRTYLIDKKGDMYKYNNSQKRQPMNPIKKWRRKREIRREIDKINSSIFNSLLSEKVFSSGEGTPYHNRMLKRDKLKRELNELD